MGIQLVTATDDPDRPSLNPDSGSRYRPAYSSQGDFWFHPLTQQSFEVTLQHTPGRGGHMAPPQTPTWLTFGVVLNIVSERVRLDYGDGGVFETPRSFQRPVLDSATRESIPWVQPPATQTIVIPIVNPDTGELLRTVSEEIAINPSHERIYGSDGLGELLNPFNSSGYSPSPERMQRLTLRFQDRPRLSVRRIKNGNRLQRMEQVLWFRFWIVAMPGRHILATSPIYTLGGWFETHTSSLRSIEPRATYFVYGLPGRHRRLYRNDSEKERAARRQDDRIRPGRGGGRLPVLTGPTANERIAAWLETEGLAPRLPTARTPIVAPALPHR